MLNKTSESYIQNVGHESSDVRKSITIQYRLQPRSCYSPLSIWYPNLCVGIVRLSPNLLQAALIAEATICRAPTGAQGLINNVHPQAIVNAYSLLTHRLHIHTAEVIYLIRSVAYYTILSRGLQWQRNSVWLEEWLWVTRCLTWQCHHISSSLKSFSVLFTVGQIGFAWSVVEQSACVINVAIDSVMVAVIFVGDKSLSVSGNEPTGRTTNR